MPSVSFKSDLSAYEDAMTASGEDYLLLVNKQTALSATYKPGTLTKVKDARRTSSWRLPPPVHLRLCLSKCAPRAFRTYS